MPISVKILRARPEHAAQLAPVMRPADLAECRAFGHADALAALEQALANSTESWVVFFDDEIAAMVGVDDLGYDVALVWALTGRAVDRARLTFMRTSRDLVEILLQTRLVLWNYVDARYQAALDWLECLGFNIGPVKPHSVTGEPAVLVFIGGR